MSGIEIITNPNTTNQDKANITATCPAGKTLVGGGARSSNPAAWVTTSGPGTVTAGKATSWVADAEEVGSIGSSTQWTLTVYAICATG